MIKVSVIVPVYNVENYLRECLDSIIKQTLKEIEILCIDDCSTDNSYSILEEYAILDNRIKILKHSENHGLGSTRNTGIKLAEGEYITFVDSDDYVSEDFLETLYYTAKKYNSDIVSNLNLYRDINGKILEYDININKYISKKERKNPKLYIEGESIVSIKDEKINTKEYLFVIACSKLFRKNFILDNDLFFIDIKLGSEDEDLYQRCLLNSPKTSYNHKGIYYYRVRDDSLTSTYNTNRNFIKNNIILMQNSINYCKERFPELLSYLYVRSFSIIFYSFEKNIYKIDNYKLLYDFVYSIDFDNSLDLYLYNQYLLIKANASFNTYMKNRYFFNRINYINEKLFDILYKTDRNNIWFKLFGINNSKEYLTIILFGVKLSIRKRI